MCQLKPNGSLCVLRLHGILAEILVIGNHWGLGSRAAHLHEFSLVYIAVLGSDVVHQSALQLLISVNYQDAISITLSKACENNTACNCTQVSGCPSENISLGHWSVGRTVIEMRLKHHTSFL